MAVPSPGLPRYGRWLRPRGALPVLFDALDRGALDFDDFLDHLERPVDHGCSLDGAVYLEAVRQAWTIAHA